MSHSKEVGTSLNEREINDLEARFPELSSLAFSAAAKRSLEAGQSITLTINNQIVRISPDGHQSVVKTIPRRVPVEAGSKIRIQ